MAEDYMSSVGAGLPESSPEPESESVPETEKEKPDGYPVVSVPSDAFGDKEPKAGDTMQFKVMSVGDGEVEIKCVSERKEDENPEPKLSDYSETVEY